MYYCAKCYAEVQANARFCSNCGYRPEIPDVLQVPPSTSPIIPAHASEPIRSVQPIIKHVPTRFLSAHAAQQFMRPAFIPGKEQNVQSEQIQPTMPFWYEQSIQAPQSALPVSSATMQPQQQLQIEEQSTGQMPPVEIVKGRPQLIEAHENFDDFDEGYIATSQAAEHWRSSWRNRQRLEAGPATTVSRGQSLVAEPLLAMQHSLMRIRAIVVPQRTKQKQQNATLGFWITLFLLISLSVGLTAYIALTYLPNTDVAARLNAPTDALQPALRLDGKQVTTIMPGQDLHLHGDNFDIGAPIIFLLDGDIAINGSNGRQLAMLTSNQGSFDVTIPTVGWPIGTHVIQAQDNKSGQSAYLNIELDLKADAATANANLSLSASPKLTFQATIGQDNPPKSVITLTNKNKTSPLTWTATAVSDDNLSWLIIDPATNSGTLSIYGTGTLEVGVDSAGLKSSTKAYTGKIIFTINKTEQLILPVELQVQSAAAEIVISPNPLVGVLDASSNTCQTGTQLVLVNISNTPISWSINLSEKANQHIQFMQTGEPGMQGQLAATGQAGDTQVLTLQCMQVQNGQVYSFTVLVNNVPWPATVAIQART
ncbi:MAG: hypothetical protein NVS4B7_01100 [Ktedonobacteraceae bacterium]